MGLNVVETLLAAGREVVLFDRGALPAPAQRSLAPYSKNGQLFVVAGDVLDARHVASAFERRTPDGVIHCAAVTSGPQREAGDPGGLRVVDTPHTNSGPSAFVRPNAAPSATTS